MWNKKIILNGLRSGQPLGFLLKADSVEWEAEYVKEQVKLLEEREIKLRQIALAEPDYQTFSLYRKTGDRSIYQRKYFDKRGKLMVYALLLWKNPENTFYKEELENILWSLCAENSWCVPAHFLTKDETPLPLEEYETQLDLFATETGYAMCEALRLCEPYLDELCVDLVKQKLRDRILNPFLDNKRIFRFEMMANNWSAVCAGAIGSVGILLLEEEELVNLLHRVMSSMDVYLASFGNDGVCVEGTDYWSYGYGFFVCFADYLKERTNGELNLFAEEKVKNIALSQELCYISGNHTLSFSDAGNQSRYRMGLSMFLKSKYPEMEIPAQEYARDVLEDGCYRFCLSLRDFLWYRQDIKVGIDAQKSIWLADAEWFLSYGSTFKLAVKAGHNGESHNHNDCGSFLLYKNGIPMLEDLGAGVYDADYFSSKRYEIFVASSLSHNVPVIEGLPQKDGSEMATKNTKIAIGEEDCFETQLQGCYESKNIIELKRSMVHRKEKEEILLSDMISFANPTECAVEERFVTHAPVVVHPGKVMIIQGGETLTLVYDEKVVEAQVKVVDYKNQKEEEKKVNVICLKTKDMHKEYEINIKIF